MSGRTVFQSKGLQNNSPVSDMYLRCLSRKSKGQGLQQSKGAVVEEVRKCQDPDLMGHVKKL